MTFKLTDKRKSDSKKSSGNRQKLVKRIKSFIKDSLPKNIGQGSVTGTTSQQSSPVIVAGSALDEPYLSYASDGDHVSIIIGNDEYERGDEIEFPESGGQGAGNGAGTGDSGQDEFVINISRDEFLKLFFEDCELPNLTNEKFTDKLDNTLQHAGFSSVGNPAQLSIIRSYKQMVGRRRALTHPYKSEYEELEAELSVLEAEQKSSTLSAEDLLRIDWINVRMLELENRISALHGFDKSDLRYRTKTSKPLKTVEAVIFFMMDISGSMSQEKKTIARRWFALLYAFIKRSYASCEIVFIAHTDEAFEMNEGDFFSTRMNGGTCVSPALQMANQIIKSRYDPAHTNTYLAHASDGDNYNSDTPLVIDELIGKGRLMNKLQFFNYVEVGGHDGYSWSGSQNKDTELWEAYDQVHSKVPDEKMSMVTIDSPDECYEIFRKVFARKDSQR
jgi:uncharacterized sporulation protein YeaH/YhbH (DUF444 family)